MAHPLPPCPPERASLAANIAFLSRPENYPDATASVHVRETHMSWVFLTERYAYKLKKPVRYPFLDFSTLERRHNNSDEEVRLNRRLAPGVYLGVVALARDPTGRLRLEGAGEPVEWLVKMRRLPDECMLDRAIAARRVPAERIANAARLLVDFYHGTPVVTLAADIYRRRINDRLETSCTALLQARYSLPAARIQTVCSAQRSFVARHPAMIDARASHVREAHGDLRPEHVCLLPAPVIIDCLEFNRDFRLLDPVDELSFLALECERLGNLGVGQTFLDTYRHATRDIPPAELIAFYQSLWAMLRARLCVWHLDDPTVSTPTKWITLALDYLALAETRVQRLT